MWLICSNFKQWGGDGARTSWGLVILSNLILLVSPILMVKVKELLCHLTPYGICSRAGWDGRKQSGILFILG